MESQKYKLRCRKKGIVVVTNINDYDVIWIRKFNTEIYSIDKLQYIQNCKCLESKPFINRDNDFNPYCRWCGCDFKKQN